MEEKNTSIGTSTKTGPRCGERARANADIIAAEAPFGSWMVKASLVIGATSGGWSSSCSAPVPQRPAGARPPTTTIGVPLKWALAMALTALVTPGPAVTAANPGVLVSFPVASAAKTAVASLRVSIRRIGPLAEAVAASGCRATASAPPTAAS